MSDETTQQPPATPWLLIGVGVFLSVVAGVWLGMEDAEPAWVGYLFLVPGTVTLGVGTVAAGIEYGMARHAHRHRS